MPSMTWGDFQSILQILLGLNIAFYAFKEIRTAKVNQIHADANWLRQVIEDLHDKVANQGSDALKDKANSLRGEVISFRNGLESFESPRGEQFENRWSFVAIIVAIFAYVLLVISSYLYNSTLNGWAALIISIGGIIPIGKFLYYNLQSVKLVNGRRQEFNKLASKWADLNSQNAANAKLVEEREP